MYLCLQIWLYSSFRNIHVSGSATLMAPKSLIGSALAQRREIKTHHIKTRNKKQTGSYKDNEITITNGKKMKICENHLFN